MDYTVATPRSSRASLFAPACYALVLLMPLGLHWPLGRALAAGVPALYATPALYLVDLATIAVLLASPARQRLRRGRAELTIPLLALLALAGATIPTALVPPLAAYTALRWLAAIWLYLAVIQFDEPPDRIVAALLAGLCLHAAVGVAQAIHQGPIGLPGEMALPPAAEGASIVAVGQTRWLRAYGLTLHPNMLGGFLAVGLVLGLPLLERRRWRLAWWLLLAGLLLSFSRSAWLGAALALPPAAGRLAWIRPALRGPLCVTLAGAGLIALAASVLLFGQVQARLSPASSPSEERSLSERDAMSAIAWQLIADRPLAGVGAGNFPVAMQRTGTPVPAQYVHHVLLLLAAEVGLAGGGLGCWLWLAPYWVLRKQWRSAGAWPVALAGAWLVLGVVGLWDSYPWGLNAGRLLVVTLLALMGRSLGAGPAQHTGEG